MLCFGVVIHDLLVEHFCRAVRDILRNGGKGFFGLPQKGIAAVGHSVCPPGGREARLEAGQDKAHEAQLLVEGGLQQPRKSGRLGLTGQNVLHAVVVTVLVVEVEVGREVLGDLLVLDILADELFVGLQAQRLIGIEQVGEVFPTAGGDELGAVHVGVYLVEVLGVQFEVAQDSAVNVGCTGVVLPDRQIRLNVHPADAVEGDNIEITDGFIVLRRVACRHDDPARRHGLIAEGLALQKLQHGGGQRLGDTVDLVDEEDALLQAGGLHLGVDTGDDLAHGVLRHRDVPAAVVALTDEGQAHGALAGVMGDGIGHQRHAALPRRLLHDLGLADARRPHQQDRALADGRDGVFAQSIFGEVRFDGMLDLFFGSFDVHILSLVITNC